jgi:hypothetical protein
LDGIPVIFVVIEPDQGGEAVREWLSRSRIRDRVRLIMLDDAKDPSELYLADRDAFVERWNAAQNAAVPWDVVAAAQIQARQAAAWKLCADIAMRPNILAEFEADMDRLGVVGERRATQLIYLIVTSRLLERPLSAAVKGPSSAGKSHTSQSVLQFFPPDAYYALSAMSERALAYSEEPLSHRVLVIYEAAGMSGEFASYLMRSLLSEGRVRYETVEKTAEGLQARLIERQGPTGLIVTTTAVQLHPENETRLLSIPVDDTPEQTRRVLRAMAREAVRPELDLGRWHALQGWLAAGECRVLVPFSESLAEAIPPVAMRLRRDFGAILNLIRAHALLHRATRLVDGTGRVVATLADYAAIHALVSDIVADGAGSTVKATVRETVEAVTRGLQDDGNKPVTVGHVAKLLGLDLSAASRRVQEARAAGYVINLEEKKGKPARLILGEHLPNEATILPSPEQLAVLVDLEPCTSAPGQAGMPAPLDQVGMTEDLLEVMI